MFVDGGGGVPDCQHAGEDAGSHRREKETHEVDWRRRGETARARQILSTQEKQQVDTEERRNEQTRGHEEKRRDRTNTSKTICAARGKREGKQKKRKTGTGNDLRGDRETGTKK